MARIDVTLAGCLMLTLAWTQSTSGQPPADSKTVATLIKQLSAAQFQAREAATRKLIAAGPAAIPQLVEVADRSPDREVASRCLRAIVHHTKSTNAAHWSAAVMALRRVAAGNGTARQAATKTLGEQPERILATLRAGGAKVRKRGSLDVPYVTVDRSSLPLDPQFVDWLELYCRATRITGLHVVIYDTPLDDDGAERFARLTHSPVLTLTLSKTRIGNRTLRALKVLQNLRGLQLLETHVDDKGLADIVGHRDLEELDVSQCKITDEGLRHVGGLIKLTEFAAAQCPLTDGGIERLRNLTKLDTLNLEGTRVTAGMLRSLAGMSELRYLYLHGTPFGDTAPADWAPLARLRSVNLSNTNVGDATLEGLGQLTQLTNLDLAGTKVSGAGLKHLVKLSRLGQLDLSETAIDNRGLTALAQIRRDEDQTSGRHVGPIEEGIDPSTPALSSLHLAHTKITDEGLSSLKKLGRISLLSLSDTAISDAGLKHLLGMPKLRMLFLYNTEVGDEGLTTLAEIKPTVLGLGKRVTDAGIPILRTLDQLESLYFSGSGITDAGVAQLKPLRRLHSLGFGETQITDRTLELLPSFTKLSYLNLYGTQITDAGLRHLHRMRQLTYLHISKTQVTDAGVAALQKALPKLRVVR